MENQTRFNLNVAMENWQSELAAQAQLTPDDRRELETHLRDSLAGLQARGLNDEESFWLARRRVGQPQQLAEEFIKNNPAKVWRERIFWGAVILLAINIWTAISEIVWAICRTAVTPYILNHPFISPFPDWVRSYLPLPSNINLMDWFSSPVSQWSFVSLLNYVPVIGVVLLLSRGRLSQNFSWIQCALRSRRRFLCLAGVLFTFYLLLILNSLLRIENQTDHQMQSTILIAIGFLRLIYPITLVAIIAWLLPTQNHRTSKHA